MFSEAEKVASAFNAFCGIELFSGNELEAAVENETVGKSPPRRRRASTVPDDEFDAICELILLSNRLTA